MAIEFSDKNFQEEVLKSEQPVLVDFWAPWCGPCQIMGPIVEELSKESGSKYKIGKLNVDENPETSQKFNIMSIPSLLIFKNGSVEKQMVGVQSKEALLSELESVDKK